MNAYLAGVLLFVAAAGAAISPHVATDADRRLERAKAAGEAYRVEEAVALYTTEIESGALTPLQLAAAYAGRAEARESYTIAYGLRDEEMLLALRDYRKARELLPTTQAYRNEAGALIALGAYDEALEAYRLARPIEKPKPHWSLIGLARVERIRGDYDAAMRHLDEVLGIWGADTATMPIYYHRARVLYLQENFAGVVDAITRGLAYQTDYPSSFEYRACAYARLGETAKALADMTEAVRLAHTRPETPAEEAWLKTPYAQAYYKGLDDELAMTKAMAAGAAGDPAALCRDTWNNGERPRTRSPLLDAAN